MSEKKRNKAKLFDLRLFPMDLARVLFSPLPLLYRVKLLTPTGEKYRHKIRGGAMVAGNHYDFYDPVVMFVAFWYRRVFFLAGELTMVQPVKRILLKGMGAIRIDRNIADMEATREAVRRMKEGHVLSIFPQGKLTKTEEITSIKSGAVLMALQAGVPIYPMYIFQREKWYKPRVAVIGDPIYPQELCTKKIPTTGDIQKISDILMKEMNNCRLLRSKEEAK